MGAKRSVSEQSGERYLKEHCAREGEIFPLISTKNVLIALEVGEIDRG